MEITQDLSARTKPDLVIDARAKTVISGYREGNAIYVPPSTVIDSISTYCHEAGHIIGDLWSFKNPDSETGETALLSIDEVKNPNTTILLTFDELQFLRFNIFSTQKERPSRHAVSIANKLLSKLTKGKFDSTSVTFYSVTQEELIQRVKDNGANTLVVDENKTITIINSKQGRNVEMPSYTVAYCCMQILENTLRFQRIFSDENQFKFFPTSSPPHQRAINIISRAFRGKSWKMPSMVDIRVSVMTDRNIVQAERGPKLSSLQMAVLKAIWDAQRNGNGVPADFWNISMNASSRGFDTNLMQLDELLVELKNMGLIDYANELIKLCKLTKAGKKLII